MTTASRDRRRRPRGAFAAAALLRAPAPPTSTCSSGCRRRGGLLRGGVAPDHQEIKRLQDTFERQTLERGCRFLGNVEVGVDITHAELMEHYTAVIYATGAQTDKSLGIPGEDLPGSRAATEFVAWYNGHPDYRDLEFDLSARRAVVIGNGNVAADVTRILALSPDELQRTDIADHALEALRASRVEEVVVLGRRGPAQAAFTSAELRELGRLEGVDTVVDPATSSSIPCRSAGWRGGHVHRAQERRAAARVRGPAAAARRPPADRPSLPHLAGRDPRRRKVEAIDVQRNAIVRAEDGTLRARPLDEAVETIECGLVLRSVGYRAVPLPDVPFDERYYVLPNERGRVLGPDGEPVPGVYAVGWIKRGPTGILGTNKRDAEETIRCLAEDLPRAAAAAADDRRAAEAGRGHGRGLARDRHPRSGPRARRASARGSSLIRRVRRAGKARRIRSATVSASRRRRS